jgi:capsid protein
MSTYDAAGTDRLLADWSGWWYRQMDAAEDWDREGMTLAQRAWKLALNDPYATALLACVTGNVLGTGLRFVSAFQADADPAVTVDELAIRQQITSAVEAHGARGRLDPSCQLSRLAIERQLVVSGFVAGDGFAIRAWKPARPGCADYGTCWRVIDASRVCNPQNGPNVPGQMVNGIEIKDGVPYRLHYCDAQMQTWSFADWYAADGTRNVIHYAPDRDRAGSMRGFSKFAPILKLATHLSRMAVAHVSGNRVKAAHPMVIQSSDPKKSADAHREQARMGPNSAINDATVLFTSKDSTATFPTYSYNGSDFDAFVRSSLMSFCAAWGYPWQFVLHQLTEGNLASAQAALDQADKTTTVYQDGVIDEISCHLDTSIISEGAARDRFDLPASVPLDRLLVGTYDRPRKADANRQRTREAAKLAIELGVAPSTALAEMGYNYADEVRRSKHDADFAAEILGPPPAQPAPPAPDAPADEPADDQVEDDEDDPADEPATAEAAMAAEPPLSRAEFQQSILALVASRQQAAPPISVHNHLPAADITVQPAPLHSETIVQAAAAAPAPAVTVQVNPTPVTIANTVQAAAPSAAPEVNVQVNPTPVTIDNQVVVPARTVKAVPQGDGSVLMTPQE